jgi:hypothetical protein
VGAHVGEGLKTVLQARFLSSRWVTHRPTSSVARSLRAVRERADVPFSVSGRF